MARQEQNSVSRTFLEGSDLASREQEVLKDAVGRTGFTSTKLLGRSAWWGSSEIGAFHYAGEIDGKKAVLKVQGVKPNTSEIFMIESFTRTNKSNVLRPPHLYATIPWDEDQRYEALVMEFIGGDKIIHVPTTQAEIDRFFELWQDYRANCWQEPWLDKPDFSPEMLREHFAKSRETSLRIYPEHPIRKPEDKDLIDAAAAVLVKGCNGVDLEFQHGHLADADLYQVGDQVVVLSNLYWSWRLPFYDAIFNYHWFIYHLNDVNGITPEEVEQQRAMWLNKIRGLPQTQGAENQRLLNLVLLERAKAGLSIDVLSADPNKPITVYLAEATRKQIKSLIAALK